MVGIGVRVSPPNIVFLAWGSSELCSTPVGRRLNFYYLVLAAFEAEIVDLVLAAFEEGIAIDGVIARIRGGAGDKEAGQAMEGGGELGV